MIDTDYLIIGSGAVGLAFADTIIDETDAHITIVDRHGKPGGHWNDAYSFVSLHQPSAFYGVNSLQLGSGQKDSGGVNAGLYELASGPEVSGYFDAVMRQKLLPTGRVSYYPMAEYTGNGRFTSLLSGKEHNINIRKKTVDATFSGTKVPSTHTPRYAVSDDVRLVPPNALAQLWMDREHAPKHFVIIGAGKTAMDVGVWLLGAGADPESISWVMPRDSWLLNRLRTQPGVEFFNETIGGQAAQMEVFASAGSVEEIFARLEAADVMLRIYPDVTPSMFHYATISKGEIAQLQRINTVIRMGHVLEIDRSSMTLAQGKVAVESNALYIDCTASAVEARAAVPIFNGNLITPQLVRAPQPVFSAALIAYVEAHYPDDAVKNALCTAVTFPASLSDFPACNIANMKNQMAWMQDKALSKWIRASRLDGFGKVIAAIDPNDTEKQEILLKLRSNAMGAMMNLHRLASEAAA